MRYIVFSSADPKDLLMIGTRALILYTQNGALYLMDMKTFEIRKIANHLSWNTHTGVRAMRSPNGKKTYFKLAESLGVINVSTLQIERYMGSGIVSTVRLSPDGKGFVWPVHDPNYREGKGVYVMNEDGSEIRRIASIEDLYELTPNKDEFKPEDMEVQHPKWSPDGKYILYNSAQFGHSQLYI